MHDSTIQPYNFVLDRGMTSKFEALAHGDFQERWEAAKTLLKFGPSVIAPLIQLCTQEADPELQWFAARILGEFDHPDAVATLSNLLQSNDEDLRSIAVSALGNIGTSAVETLTEQLAREETRLQAAQALACMRCPSAIAPLIDLARDADPSLRTTAIAALSRFPDPDVLPVLVGALEDLAASVRQEAAIGLGLVVARLRNKESGIPHPEETIGATGDLQSHAQGSPYTGEELVDLLGKRLRDFNLGVCQQAAIALSRAGTDAAASAIYRVLVAPTTPILLQLESIRALGWIGTLPALEYLEKALTYFDTPAPQFIDLWREIIAVLSRAKSADLSAKAVQILIDLLKCDRPALQHASIRQAIALGLGQLGDRTALDSLMQLASDRDLSVRLHAATALKQLNEKCVRSAGQIDCK